MNADTPPSRCRLVLMLTGERLRALGATAADIVDNALSGGDVASLIFAQNTLEEAEFIERVRACVETAQRHGVAAIIAGDARVAGRCGADGIQYGQDVEGLRDGVERFAPKMIVGCGNVRSRHTALIIGEAMPDYMMFGKPGGDERPAPLPRNLELAQWWAAMIEIPCIAVGGSDAGSALDVARTGAEFAALGRAIFGSNDDTMPPLEGPDSPSARVAAVNALLDAEAPQLIDADEQDA